MQHGLKEIQGRSSDGFRLKLALHSSSCSNPTTPKKDVCTLKLF